MKNLNIGDEVFFYNKYSVELIQKGWIYNIVDSNIGKICLIVNDINLLKNEHTNFSDFTPKQFEYVINSSKKFKKKILKITKLLKRKCIQKFFNLKIEAAIFKNNRNIRLRIMTQYVGGRLRSVIKCFWLNAVIATIKLIFGDIFSFYSNNAKRNTKKTQIKLLSEDISLIRNSMAPSPEDWDKYEKTASGLEVDLGKLQQDLRELEKDNIEISRSILAMIIAIIGLIIAIKSLGS
jgi:hypothetical protein